MKKLLYLGFTALTMLFAMPSVVRADEGETTEPTTPAKLTVSLTDMDMTPLATTGSNEVGRYLSVYAMVGAPQVGGQTPAALYDGEEPAPTAAATVLYYTFDATVTLTHAAYKAQTDGKILMSQVASNMGQLFTYTEEDNATLRVVACQIENDAEVESVRSEEASYQLTFKNVAAPVFSETAAQVVSGTTVTITNIPAVSGSYAVYSTNGALPTYDNQGEVDGVKQYNTTNGIKIEGEVGSTVTVKAINYEKSAESSSDLEYGSKMTTVTYTIKTDEPVVEEKTAAPTFKVGNDVATTYELPADADASVTVTIVVADGATVYYTTDGTEPTTATTTTGTSVTINSACTLMAIAQEIGKAASEVASFVVTKASAPVTPTPDPVVKPEAPSFTPEAGAYFSGTRIIVQGDWGDTVYYCIGSKTGEYINHNESQEFFPLEAAMTVYAFVIKEGVSSDTVDASYTIKANPTFEGSLSIVSPVAGEKSSYAFTDSIYNIGAPVFEANVEGVELGNPVYLRYRLYQDFDGKDSLMMSGVADEETFSIPGYGSLANGVYKVVIDIIENGPNDMNNERIRIAYTTPDGKAVEEVRYIRVAAPVWTLAYPELKTVENEFGFETTEPFLLRRGKGMKVLVAADNCEGLFGTGEGQLLISKRAYANSLFENPDVAGLGGIVAGLGGIDAYYEVMDTMIVGGVIDFTLPEGWVDSVRKAIAAEVNVLFERQGGSMMDEEEKEAFYAMFALKEEEDLSGCSVRIVAGNFVDYSEYGMGMVFEPTYDYESMYVEVPFTVIDTIYAPEFSLESGEVTINSELLITADLESDTIYYRVDAEAFKKAESAVVTISIDKDMTVEAYAISMEGLKSTTTKAAYTVVEDPNLTLTVKAVGATMNADTAAFTHKVVYDIFVDGETDAKDSLIIAFYDKAAYESIYDRDPSDMSPIKIDTIKIVKMLAADSVRFEAADLANGAYVATVELVRAGEREEVVTDAATLYLTLSAVANERAGELAGVNVYPNPNNGTFNVVVPERARIDIFGLNGAKVMGREANAGVEVFSINHSGIYFVRVMAGNKAAVKRVVVR